MLKIFKSNTGFLLLLIVFFMCFIPFFFLHQGLLAVDTGREFYIPSQILKGNILYKDILNIYGPFSYQFNAFLFFVFGEKINTLYIAGILNSLLIIILLYFISLKFLSRNISFLICITTMFSLVFSTFLYNSNITYSYAIVYALSSLMLSVLFLLKYTENSKTNYAFLSCFFMGLSILNKYEFILCPVVHIYVLAFLIPVSFKDKLKSIFCFILPFILSFSLLFFQGLTLKDLYEAFNIMTSMANADSMRIFYSNFGNFFNIDTYIRLFTSNPIFALLGLLPVFNLFIFVLNFKKIYENKILFIFCLFSMLACFKFLLFLNIEHMGAFLFPLCLLTAIVLSRMYSLPENIKYILLCALIMFFAFYDFSSLEYKNYLLQSEKGSIYTFKKDGEPIKIVSDFIVKNTKIEDKIVILPEGLFINFITDRSSDNIFYTLSPLYYTDTFGEDKVIKHYTYNCADYLVILPLSMIEYGSNLFCDYAKSFCEMISKNYSLVFEKDNIRIYKRKNFDASDSFN